MASLYGTRRQEDIFIKYLYPPQERVDWEGIMGAVRNQGQHDSCWSIAVSESIMAMLRRRDNDPNISLAPQDLLDFCVARKPSKTRKGHYCYIYDFPQAFNYVRDQGIQKEVHRPYIGCSPVVPRSFRDPFQCSYIKRFISFKSVHDAVKKFGEQPVCAHLAMFIPDFQLDHGDIYRGPTRNESRFDALHAVSLVDKGMTEQGENYVVARLSNGPRWGENGYVKVSVDTRIWLRNPDQCTNETEKLFFSTERRILVNFVCPELLSEEEEQTRPKKRKRDDICLPRSNKRRKLAD